MTVELCQKLCWRKLCRQNYLAKGMMRTRKLALLLATLSALVLLLVLYLPYSGRREEVERTTKADQTVTSTTDSDPAPVHGVRNTGENDPTLLMDTEELAQVKLPRVFCWITTMEKMLGTKVRAINSTWVRRCDGHIYVMTTKRNISDVIDLGVPEGRGHLTAKTMKAMEYLYNHHLNDYDWFLKGDDDAYFVMENLKFLLSHYNSSQAIYTGHLFKKYHKVGYMSGGAGYVLSRQAVKVVVEQGILTKGKCAEDSGDEDVKLGLCLHKIGVPSHESIDKFGRETFHPFGALAHIGGPMPPGLDEYDRHPTKIGQDCCSQLTISYHYNSPQLIYLIEQMLYRTSVFGRRPKPISHFKDFFKVGEASPLPEAPK